MDADFDPYFKWLGIPRDEQPPNRYRLLGVPIFTDDLDVIENLADQRIRHVRMYQLGEHAEHAHQILNELAAARAYLLDPARKSAYDTRLRGDNESQQDSSHAFNIRIEGDLQSDRSITRTEASSPHESVTSVDLNLRRISGANKRPADSRPTFYSFVSFIAATLTVFFIVALAIGFLLARIIDR